MAKAMAAFLFGKQKAAARDGRRLWVVGDAAYTAGVACPLMMVVLMVAALCCQAKNPTK
jgi:hypothetical protein